MGDADLLLCAVLLVFRVALSSAIIHPDGTRDTPAPVWPPHQKTYDHRPQSSSYCKAGIYPFCPSGLPQGKMPKVAPKDTLFVYAMKAPVWEFKFGKLLANFDIMHDAIGFHHVQSGLNITMEWYELFQLFNCTFPHLRTENKSTELQWCNQGAACLYMGIDEKHWKQNGTLVKVSSISGDIFNNFISWTQDDNNTYPFYETWTVMDAPGKNTWFKPFDCASWVLRAFDTLHDLGASFDQSVHLNYTKIILYSKEPKLVGNATTIYENATTLDYLASFYDHFQKRANMADTLLHLLLYLDWFEFHKQFYIFYNAEYWELDVARPYIQLTYDEVPLPKNSW